MRSFQSHERNLSAAEKKSPHEMISINKIKKTFLCKFVVT